MSRPQPLLSSPLLLCGESFSREEERGRRFRSAPASPLYRYCTVLLLATSARDAPSLPHPHPLLRASHCYRIGRRQPLTLDVTPPLPRPHVPSSSSPSSSPPDGPEAAPDAGLRPCFLLPPRLCTASSKPPLPLLLGADRREEEPTALSSPANACRREVRRHTGGANSSVPLSPANACPREVRRTHGRSNRQRPLLSSPAKCPPAARRPLQRRESRTLDAEASERGGVGARRVARARSAVEGWRGRVPEWA